MIGEDSPVKPYMVEGRACYFLDRDPKHFSTILNYLRNGGQLNTHMLPRDIRQLRQLHFEAHFYGLDHLEFNVLKPSRHLKQGLLFNIDRH